MPRHAPSLTWTITATLTLILIANARADDAELKRLRDENAALRARVKQLEAELARLRTTTQQLKQEKQQLVTERKEKQAKSDAYFVKEHTSEGGATVLRTRAMSMDATHGTRDPHWLSAESAAGNTAVSVTVTSVGTGGVYRSTDRLEFTVDGKTVVAEVKDYDSKRKTTGSFKNRRRIDDETITAALSAADIATIAAGREVSVRVGPSRFSLTEEQRTAFGVLLRKIGK